MAEKKRIKLKITELREAAGLTQKELADLSGTTETTVANWEHERTGVEQIVRVAKICKALNCLPWDLYEEVDND
jgi:transcriptional regulator with XRE-family HTH domain